MLFNPFMSFIAPGLATVPPSPPRVREKIELSSEVIRTAQQTFVRSQIEFQTQAYLVAHKAMCDAVFAPAHYWASIFRAKT